MHPDNCGFDATGFAGRSGDGGDHVAAAEVDFVFEGEHNGLGRAGAGEVAIKGGDGSDAGATAAGEGKNFVAGTDGAGGDLAGKAAEILVGAEDALNGQPKGCLCALDGEGKGFEQLEDAGAGVVGHARAAMDDVVAIESTDGNRD